MDNCMADKRHGPLPLTRILLGLFLRWASKVWFVIRVTGNENWDQITGFCGTGDRDTFIEGPSLESTGIIIII